MSNSGTVNILIIELVNLLTIQLIIIQIFLFLLIWGYTGIYIIKGVPPEGGSVINTILTGYF